MSDSSEKEGSSDILALTKQVVHIGRVLEQTRDDQQAQHREVMREIRALKDRVDGQDRQITDIKSSEKNRASRLAEVYDLARKASEDTKTQAHESAEHRGQVIAKIAELSMKIGAVDARFELVDGRMAQVIEINEHQTVLLQEIIEERKARRIIAEEDARRAAEAEAKRDKTDKRITRLGALVAIAAVLGPAVFWLLTHIK